jgi:hypothetical protein
MTDHNKAPMDAISQEAAPVHKNLASALACAQSEMGRALKSASNLHFKSKYADLASVVEACMPSLNRHGIAVIQPPYDDETGSYVKTILIHGETGETLECRVPLIVQKNDMQGYGSAVTYARRYGLMGMTGLAPEDDDGNAAAQAAPKREAERPTFDAAAATKRIKGKMAMSETLDDLKERWTQELDTIAEVKAASADLFGEIEAAKNARRDAIQAAASNQPRPSDDLGGDEIPY